MTTDDQVPRDIEYARAVMQIASDDVRQIYVRVTGVLGLAVIFVTQLPFARLVNLPLWTRWVLAVGLASAIASAALNFQYLTMVHLARLDMARSVRDGNAGSVEQIWVGRAWTRHGWAFIGGTILLALSVCLLGLTLGVLLKLVP